MNPRISVTKVDSTQKNLAKVSAICTHEISGIHENIYESQLQEKHDVNLGSCRKKRKGGFHGIQRQSHKTKGFDGAKKFQETTKPITEVIGRM